MPLIYEELRKMARRYMSQQNPGHTLQTTALIHEALPLFGLPLFSSSLFPESLGQVAFVSCPFIRSEDALDEFVGYATPQIHAEEYGTNGIQRCALSEMYPKAVDLIAIAKAQHDAIFAARE